MQAEAAEKREAGGVPHPARVLLAEDGAEMRRHLARSLREDGFDVTEDPDGLALVAHLWHGFDVVVSDTRMPGLSGLQILDDGNGVRVLPVHSDHGAWK